MRFLAGLSVLCLLAGWFAPCVLAQAAGQAFTVADNAGMFSEDAKRSANNEIARIRERTGKDFLIETFKSAPDTIKKVDLKDKKAKSEFFTKWAAGPAKNSKVNGVYVLICQDPKYVQLVAGKVTLNKGAFISSHLKILGKTIRAKLTEKKPDEALDAAVTYVGNTLPARRTTVHTNVPNRRPVWTVWRVLTMVLVVALVVWLVQRVISRMFRPLGLGRLWLRRRFLSCIHGWAVRHHGRNVDVSQRIWRFLLRRRA